MELLKLIQQSNITCIAYVSRWENLIQMHLEQLDDQITYLTTGSKTLGEIIEEFSDISNIRDLKLSTIFNDSLQKIYYVIDLNQIIFPDTYNAPINNSNYVRDRLRELSTKIYNLKNEYNLSLIILSPSYYRNDTLEVRYGHGTLYLSELVITFDEHKVEITKNHAMSDNQTCENIQEYTRNFYLNHIFNL